MRVRQECPEGCRLGFLNRDLDKRRAIEIDDLQSARPSDTSRDGGCARWRLDGNQVQQIGLCAWISVIVEKCWIVVKTPDRPLEVSEKGDARF